MLNRPSFHNFLFLLPVFTNANQPLTLTLTLSHSHSHSTSLSAFNLLLEHRLGPNDLEEFNSQNQDPLDTKMTGESLPTLTLPFNHWPREFYSTEHDVQLID